MVVAPMIIIIIIIIIVIIVIDRKPRLSYRHAAHLIAA